MNHMWNCNLEPTHGEGGWNFCVRRKSKQVPMEDAGAAMLCPCERKDISPTKIQPVTLATS